MNTSKRAIYYQQAEDLYIQQGFSLQIIEDLFKGKVTRRTLNNWKNEFNWDGKRAKFLDTTQSLIDGARELVNATLERARLEPSSKNIAAYSRAISALKNLEAVRIMDVSDEETGAKEITPEKAAEIRKKVLGI